MQMLIIIMNIMPDKLETQITHFNETVVCPHSGMTDMLIVRPNAVKTIILQ